MIGASFFLLKQEGKYWNENKNDLGSSWREYKGILEFENWDL